MIELLTVSSKSVMLDLPGAILGKGGSEGPPRPLQLSQTSGLAGTPLSWSGQQGEKV